MVYDKECLDVIDQGIDKTYGITHIYFTKEEYEQIGSFTNNHNIVKIHYLKI
jgi:hypothetical protein